MRRTMVTPAGTGRTLAVTLSLTVALTLLGAACALPSPRSGQAAGPVEVHEVAVAVQEPPPPPVNGQPDDPTGPAPRLDPASFEVDSSLCPADPEASFDGDDGPIRIGINGGGFNGSRHIDGVQAAIDEANAAGGIDGRPIELITAVETQSDGPNVAVHLNALLDRGDLHAVVPWGGWPDPGEVTARFALECVPGLFWLALPASDVGWVTPGLGDPRAELAVVARWLATEVDSDHVLVVPADWPSEISAAESMVVALKGEGIERWTLAPLAVNPTFRLTTDAAETPGVDAVVIATGGAGCIEAVHQVRREFPDAVIVVSRWCEVVQPAAIGPLDPFDGIHRLRLSPARVPDEGAFVGTNYAVADLTGRAVVEVLRVAASLDGGVTRANIWRAANTLSTVVTVPDPLPGAPAPVVLQTAGPDDPFALESGLMEVFQTAPPDGGELGWHLLADHPIDANGATPFTPIDRTLPPIVEERLPLACPGAGETEILTAHWFGEGGALDPLADIILLVRNVDLGPEPAATLVATGADGTRIELTMTTRGGNGSGCAGEVGFDVIRGDPARINDLAQPVAITFELSGGHVTGAVTWPDDFPLAPPFGNVYLHLE